MKHIPKYKNNLSNLFLILKILTSVTTAMATKSELDKQDMHRSTLSFYNQKAPQGGCGHRR